MTAERIPVVVVGAGAMGRVWIDMLADHPDARLVGVADLDVDLATRTVAEVGAAAGARTGDGMRDVLIGPDVVEVARLSGAAAVIDVTVPGAHRVVNEAALRAGLPVLCEKPLAPSLAEALQQVALTEITGGLLMVSQSRRNFRHLSAFRDAVRALGPLAIVTAQFLHEDHEPGFREQMAHPLLVDMSIHHFDQLRFLTTDEPVAVRCTSWNPPWSWFAGDAAATADFELASGARFQYAGSRATPGLRTSWNAEWRVQGERGGASWDGEETVVLDDGDAAAILVPDEPESIAASTSQFVQALRTGRTPATEVRANIRSLAMMEAAIRSSDAGGERVVIADLLEESWTRAIADERREDVAERLRSWGSAAEGIASAAWGDVNERAGAR